MKGYGKGVVCVMGSGTVEKENGSRDVCVGMLNQWWDFRATVASRKSTSVEVGFCLMMVPVAHRWLGVG